MGVREYLDSVEHHFDKGGKYEKWYALYEAVDTFFYRPPSVTRTTAHVRDGIDLKRMMITVWLCTFPAMFFGMWNIGHQANSIYAANPDLLAAQDNWRLALISVFAGFDPGSLWDNMIHGAAYFLPVYLVTFLVGGFWEVLFASVRKHEVNEGFFVTSVLFALACPPSIPLWQVALGISSSVSGRFRSCRTMSACCWKKLRPAGTTGQEADIPRRLTRLQKRTPMWTSAPLTKRTVVSGMRSSTS